MECGAEKLAILVGERRPIYDFTIKEHNNRELIDALWEEVAQAMSSSVPHCKAKWWNLRNCYSRYLRTMKSAPSPLTGKRKKKWYLADVMTFLDPFMSQTRKQEQNFEELPLEVTQDFKEDAESSDSQNIQPPPMVVTEFKTEDDVYDPPAKKPQRMLYGQSEVVDFQYRKPYPPREDEGAPPTDPDFDFFKCLFRDFKKLRPRRQRRFKELMLRSLHRCLDEEEDEQSLGRTSPKTSGQNDSAEVVNTSQDVNFGSPPYSPKYARYSDTE